MKKIYQTFAGHGLINKTIDALPIELHLPGYQFCGPGTKLNKRLARGDSGINALDTACREHDIAYSNKNPELRQVADRILLKKAMQRVASSSASAGEKIAALIVAGAMKTKLMIGGSVRKRGLR